MLTEEKRLLRMFYLLSETEGYKKASELAAKLQISSQELAQWLENRNQAQQFAAKASFDDKLQGFVILTEAVTDLAEDIKKKAASDAQSWSGH